MKIAINKINSDDYYNGAMCGINEKAILIRDKIAKCNLINL